MTLTDAFDGFPTARTLVVTVQSDGEFQREGRDAIEALERGESVEQPDTFSFPSIESLFETFTPHTMGLLRTVAESEPESIRETARLTERDVKNVHDELSTLERLGLIRFEQQGRAKRPVFPYEEIVISVPFDRDTGDVAEATS